MNLYSYYANKFLHETIKSITKEVVKDEERRRTEVFVTRCNVTFKLITIF